MKIAISRDYLDLATALSEKGYEVSIECDKSDNCDIIICNLKNDDLVNYNFGSTYKKEGTLIIDKGNKSISEIENIIKSRGYNYKNNSIKNFT